MSTNPSHILIARNSRGGTNSSPSAALSSPTETHAAAAGIFRSSGPSAGTSAHTPAWFLEECETDDDELEADLLSTDGDENDPIDVDATFTKDSDLPGSVKIVVESTTFW